MNTQYLSSESSLQGGRYRIVRMLGSGGFGITYLGTQTGLERNIVIKEFFMTDYCLRDEYSNLLTVPTVSNVEFVERFKDKFLKEARHIAQLKHPNIVNIIDVFEENGTAYYVMDFIEGGSLAEKVQSEGSLPENVAKRYILQIADALNYIHQRYMNHLDVKPGNIMLSRNDNAILIDFGLSKQYDSQTGHQTSTTPVGISHGYAPMEQYKEGGVSEFSPETDIYSLGATLYYLLTGARPPVSQEINEDGLTLDQLKAKNISWPTISAIINAMKPRKKERTHDINTFIAELNAGIEGDITSPGNTGPRNTGQGYAAPGDTTDPRNTGPGGSRSNSAASVKELRSVIEGLQQQGLLKEAYNQCLENIRNNVDVEFSKEKSQELVELLKEQTKKGNVKTIILFIVVFIVSLIISIIANS